MAGLGVILEPKKSLPKCPQILSKVTSFKPPSSSLNAPPPPPPPPLPTSPCMSPFLESCFLCHQPLSQTKDIYMYRGDRAFCSEECRCRQIYMDEETVVRDNCSVAAVGGGAAACRRGKKAREASGFAY